MGDLVQLHNHMRLGELALDNLAKGRTQLALQNLAQAWLDAAEDRDRAYPIAEQIKAFGNLNGGGAA